MTAKVPTAVVLTGVVSILLVLAAIGTDSMLAQAASPDDTKTIEVFKANCTACHSIGKGDGVGPDLMGLHERLAKELAAGTDAKDWFKRWLDDPAGMKEKDEYAKRLSAKFPADMAPQKHLANDYDALWDFIGRGGPGLYPSKPPLDLSEANRLRGESLFYGNTRFASRVPACVGCHSVDGMQGFGGGNVGPDLTGAFARFKGKEAALAEFFTGELSPAHKNYRMPIPKLEDGVTDGDPVSALSESEAGALMAYFYGVARAGGMYPRTDLLAVYGALSALALLIVINMFGGKEEE